ncbi:hypothetical protein HY772_09250 [Candidatus Woesearchaeota archaeon]|nr:hypothetical protein [Candidatus Woesearchaeota archaeon]
MTNTNHPYVSEPTGLSKESFESILEKVLTKEGLSYTYERLQGGITGFTVEQTEITMYSFGQYYRIEKKPVAVLRPVAIQVSDPFGRAAFRQYGIELVVLDNYAESIMQRVSQSLDQALQKYARRAMERCAIIDAPQK